MYDYVIFDVDGTLIDTEKAIMASLNRVLMEELGKDFSGEDLSFVLGIPGTASLPKLGISDVDTATRKWNDYLKDYFDYVSVFEGMEAVLASLKDKGISLGIVTSKTKEELECDFVPFGLMKYMEHVVCADDTTRHKPYPEPVLKLLERAQAHPSSVIFIGDTPYDYECAKGAGVEFGLALWGAKNPDEIGCRYKFGKPEDIVELLNNNAK